MCIADTNFFVFAIQTLYFCGKTTNMILLEELEHIINEQNFFNKKEKIIEREICLRQDTDRVTVISGVRRCGKSTLLKLYLSDNQNCLFINFEDTRLEYFDVSDFRKIEKIAKNLNKTIYIFDEIQNIYKWEKYIRSAHDNGNKIYITGSNASMLSKELGTKLTGRYIQTELFPFTYREFLKFYKYEANSETYKKYLVKGGFPEYLKEENTEYLRTLLKDIVIRDIAVRRNIKNEHQLIRLAVFLMTNAGKELSYNKITKNLQIKSVRTTIDYCDYLQESYLFEFIPRFSFSLKQQQINPKKVYAIDTGMAKANSLSLQDDNGRMLENAVYLQLRQYSNEISYFKDDKSECDFIVQINNKPVLAVQVCWVLNTDNMQRELNGLKNAMKTADIKKGLIITLNQKDELEGIQVLPVWSEQFANNIKTNIL